MQKNLNDKQDKVERMLKMIGLESFRDDYPGPLSGGKAQRVALCTAMLFSMAARGTKAPEGEDTTVGEQKPEVSNMSEEEAMKLEPAYEKGITYWYDGGNCTASPYLAKKIVGCVKKADIWAGKKQRKLFKCCLTMK